MSGDITKYIISFIASLVAALLFKFVIYPIMKSWRNETAGKFDESTFVREELWKTIKDKNLEIHNLQVQLKDCDSSLKVLQNKNNEIQGDMKFLEADLEIKKKELAFVERQLEKLDKKNND